jgi:hypothetical protein
VVGLETERFEIPAVAEEGFELGEALVTGAVNRAKQARELGDVVGIEPPGEQHRFPVLVRLRHRRHRQDMVLKVFEDKGRDRARWGELGEPAQTKRLAVDALRRTEPIDLDPQLGESLLQHPGLAGRTLDEDSPIRHAAGEHRQLWLLIRWNPSRFVQIAEQRFRLLDIEIDAHPPSSWACAHTTRERDDTRFERGGIGLGLIPIQPLPDRAALTRP